MPPRSSNTVESRSIDTVPDTAFNGPPGNLADRRTPCGGDGSKRAVRVAPLTPQMGIPAFGKLFSVSIRPNAASG
jgi:hypothetical protein